MVFPVFGTTTLSVITLRSFAAPVGIDSLDLQLKRLSLAVLLKSYHKVMQFSFDPNWRDIADKVEAGERLTFDEGMSFSQPAALTALGKLADPVRRKKHALTTYYNVNRHFNHTNICVADCKFCGFYKRAREEGAYTHSVADAIEIALTAMSEAATALHIVRGRTSKF